MPGLMGNFIGPYYAGGSGWAQGLNNMFGNAADIALKAIALNQERDKMNMQNALWQAQKREAEAQAAEREDRLKNLSAMREALGTYDAGLMRPVGEQAQASFDLVESDTVPESIAYQYPNQYEAWRSAGKKPEQEYLKGAYSVIAQYDPEKALALREKLYSATTQVELKEALMNLKNAAAQAQLDMKEKWLNWRDKNAAEDRTSRENIALMRIAAGGGKQSDETKMDMKRIDALRTYLGDLQKSYDKALLPREKARILEEMERYKTELDSALGISSGRNKRWTPSAPATKRKDFSTLW